MLSALPVGEGGGGWPPPPPPQKKSEVVSHGSKILTKPYPVLSCVHIWQVIFDVWLECNNLCADGQCVNCKRVM
jgi:hypothetical protein